MALLVITGAGASFDSVRDEYLPPGVDMNLKPPLVTGLFENRPNYGPALDEFYQAIPLISDLRRAVERGQPLERELERLQSEVEDYPQQLVGLTALRYYLQQILWETGEAWNLAAHGATNYVDLLRRLDKWRRKQSEKVIYVTFNYDLLLEYAFQPALGFSVRQIDDYIERPDWKFLKLHGSVNWGRPMRDEAAVNFGRDFKIRRHVIENAASLIPPKEYVVSLTRTAKRKEWVLYPALAIPVETKKDSDFECPDGFLQLLRDNLVEIDRIVVIGWRGGEKHFLDLLHGSPRFQTPVLIVNGSEEGAMEARRNLETTNMIGEVFPYDGGFSRFLDDGLLLENFLTETEPAARMNP